MAHREGKEDDGAYFYGVPGGFDPAAMQEALQHVMAAMAAASPTTLSGPGGMGAGMGTLAAGAPAAIPGATTTKSWAAVASKLPPPDAVGSGSGGRGGSTSRGGRAGARHASTHAPSSSDGEAGSGSTAPAASPTTPLCTFYLNTTCRRGASCRYRHVKPTEEGIRYFLDRITADKEAAATSVMSMAPTTALAGTAASIAAGKAAQTAAATAPTSSHAADATAPAGGEGGGAGAVSGMIWDDDVEFAAAGAEWQESSNPGGDAVNAALVASVASGVAASIEEAEAAWQVAERRAATDVSCGICFDQVTAIPGRRFGLLTGCNHPFCLDCLRTWRGRIDLPKETVRSCPLCRKLSYFVIPCDRYVTDSARKAALNDEYHQQQRAIPCRYWNYGKGTCPFGSSCWYAHLNPDGTPAIMPKHVVRVDGEGTVSVSRVYRLNEFLG